MKKLIIIILLFLLLTTNVGQAQFNDSEPMFGQLLNLGHWSTDGLVFYWRGIPAGNVVDESYYGNNGTITGATWVGNGLSFDGFEDYVTGMLPSITEVPFTLIVFCRVTDTTGPSQLISISDFDTTNKHIYLDNYGTGGVSRFIVRNIDFIAAQGPDISDGQWHMVVGVASGSNADVTMEIYVDGVLEGTNSSTMPTNLDVQSLGVLGRSSAYATDFLEGDIAYAFIYNRALSASEIAALYLNPNIPMQQPPIWLFYSPAVVGGSLQPIIDGGIGPTILGGSVVR